MLLEAIRGTRSFLLNRLLSGIWVPMLVATVLGSLLSLALGWSERTGWTAGLGQVGGPLGFGPGTAETILTATLSIQVSILTLYFSITLLVLTLGAQALGGRLIERWIAGIETRATLAQWAGLVAFSLIGLAFVAPDLPDPAVPRLLVLADLVLTVIALGWLGYGYNQLARTAQVDTTIAELGRSFAQDYQSGRVGPGPADPGPPDRVLTAWRSGYLSSVDFSILVGHAKDTGGRLRLLRPVGEFVLHEEPLAEIWCATTDLDAAFRETCELVDYRTDRADGPFALSLIVEIAARALSPGINDYETAASCADWLGHGLAKRLALETEPDGWFLDEDRAPRLQVPDCGVLGQSRRYLAVFNRWSRDHPYVTEHLIRAYRGALAHATQASDRAILNSLLQEVAQAPANPARTPREAAMVEESLLHDAAPPAPKSPGVAAAQR